VAWGSVFGLVIGYALSRVRHANSPADLLLSEYTNPGTSFRWETGGGLFLMTLQGY
jgi:hypothetical protein